MSSELTSLISLFINYAGGQGVQLLNSIANVHFSFSLSRRSLCCRSGPVRFGMRQGGSRMREGFCQFFNSPMPANGGGPFARRDLIGVEQPCAEPLPLIRT